MADFTVEGIIDVDASKGIASIKAFRSMLDGLYTDLKKIDQSISKIDGRTIDIDVDVASGELEKLREDLEAIDDLKATVDLDTTAAQVEAQKLKDELDFNEDVHIGFDSIEEEIAAINAEIDTINDAQIDVDIDRHKALIQSEKLREEIDAVFSDDITQEVKIDVDKDSEKRLNELTNSIGGAGGLGTGGLIAALVLLASTVGPIGGVLAAAVAGMGGSMGVLATGIAAFGIIGIPVFKDVTDAIKLLAVNTDELTPEKLKEYNKAVQAMKDDTPNIWAAAQAFEGLQKNYKKWSDSLRPEIIEIFSGSLQILNQLLDYAGPIANSAADGFLHLMEKMEGALATDGDWAAFFDYVDGKIEKFINMWGTAVGNFLTGIANMIVGFDPLTEWFNKGLVGMSEDFLKWSQTFSQSEGFKTFVQFVKDNGPTVGSIIGGLIGAIINLAKALAPLGEEVLKNVNGFLDWYNQLSKTNPKAAKFGAMALAIGLAVAPLVGFLANLVIPMATLLPLFAGIGSATAVLALFGGLAVAVAFLNPQTEHFAGMMSTLKDTWAVIVDVGKKLWQVLQDIWLMLEQSGAVDDIQAAFTSLFNIIQDLAPLLIPILEIMGVAFVLAFAMAAKAIMLFLKGVEIIVDILKPVIDWVVDKFQWLFDKLVGHSIIPDLINGIIDWFKKLPGKIVEILINMVTGAITWFTNLKNDAIAKAGELITGFVSKMQQLKDDAVQKVIDLKNAAGEKLGEIKQAFVEKAGEIVTGFITKFIEIKSDTVTKLGELKSAITGFFSGAFDWLVNAGAQIIAGLISGLTSKLDELRSIASSIGGILSDVLPGSPVKEGPLKVLNDGYAGKQIISMLMDGINTELPALENMLNKTMPDMVGEGFFNDAASGAAVGTVVNNYYDVTATVPVGANLAEAGREISEALDAFEGSGGRRI